MSQTASVEDARSDPLGPWWERTARRLVNRRLSAIRAGELSVECGDRTDHFGSNEGQAEPLRGRIVLRRPGFYSRVARRGALGAAEAYMDGLWSSDDLPAVLRVAARNAPLLRRLDSGIARFARPGLRLLHASRANSRRGQPDQHRSPLRSRRLVLRAVSRRDLDLLVRAVRAARRHARRGTDRQVRARGAQAPTSAERSRAGNRGWLGWLCRLRGQPLRLPGDQHDDLRGAVRSRPSSGSPVRGSRGA